MKNAVKTILIVVVIVMAGCAIFSKVPKEHRDAFKNLQGSWEEIGGTKIEIVAKGNTLEVISIVDTDGEIFVVKNTDWSEGMLEWTYWVPSTGYTVTMKTTSIEPEMVDCEWVNDYNTGTERLFKIK